MKPHPRFSSQTQIDPRESFRRSPRDDVTIGSSRCSHPPRIDRLREADRKHDARANWSHFCTFKCHTQGFRDVSKETFFTSTQTGWNHRSIHQMLHRAADASSWSAVVTWSKVSQTDPLTPAGKTLTRRNFEQDQVQMQGTLLMMDRWMTGEEGQFREK